MRDRLIDEVFRVIEDAIVDLLRSRSSAGGGGGGFGGLFLSIAGAVAGGFAGGGGGAATAAQGTSVTGTSSVSSFAHGGSFTVGGAGGIDRNLVQFKASRGERVDITPAGQSNGNGTTIFIDATGADPAAIARLESALFEAVGPGRIERRAVSGVVSARRRNPNLFGIA